MSHRSTSPQGTFPKLCRISPLSARLWCNFLANPPSNAIITSDGLWNGRAAYTIFQLISLDRQVSPDCAVISAILGVVGLRSCPRNSPIEKHEVYFDYSTCWHCDMWKVLLYRSCQNKNRMPISLKKKPMAEFEKFGLLIPHVLTQ
jgi:hypothetical protein